MKRIITVILSLAASLVVMAQVRITTPETELIIKADKGADLQILYFGARLSDADAANIEAAAVPGHSAYRAYGLWCA